MNRSSGKGPLLAVFLAVMVDLMGFGIILPLLPYAASRYQASPLMVGLLYSVYSFAQLFFAPLWGNASDRVGRRPIMLFSTLGSFLSYLIFAFAPNLTVLFLSRALAGIMGGNISAAQAYVADVTKPEERAKGMGMIGAAFGIGFALGPAISGALMLGSISKAFPWIAEHPFALPGFIAAFLSLGSFALVLFRLPESLSLNSSPDATRVEKFSVFSGVFWREVLFQKERPLLTLLFVGSLMLAMGHSTLYSAFPLYCKEALRLGPEKVGFQFLWMGVIAIVVQGGLIRPLVKRFGECRLYRFGTVLMCAAIALLGIAHSEKDLMIYLFLLAVGGSLNGPTLTSLVSKSADPKRMGRSLGVSQGMSALGRVLGPAWGGFLFGMRPSLPFFATGAVLAMAVLMSFSPKMDHIS